jgi:oligosaccharide translocation protein RFT1
MPMEDTCRLYFAKTLTCKTSSFILIQALEFLFTMIKFHIILGSFFAFFGSNFTGILLDILYSKSTTETAKLLSAYCFYVPVMGVNGLTEAFLQGVGTGSVITLQTLFMVVLWVVYISTTYIFVIVLDCGSIGMIYSNIVNMGLRILFSYSYISKFFINQAEALDLKDKKGLQLVFRKQTIFTRSILLWGAFFCSWALTYSTKGMHFLIHLSIGISSFFLVCGILFQVEKDKLFKNLYSYFKDK